MPSPQSLLISHPAVGDDGGGVCDIGGGVVC